MIGSLAPVFAEARAEGRAVLVGYVPAGFPSVDGGIAALRAMVESGVNPVGDPKLDLAWMVQSWPEDTNTADAAEASYVDLQGMPTRPQMVDYYAQVSGRQVDDLDYYLVLAKWKLAIVLEQGFQRAGNDEKLQAFGPLVLELMTSAAELAESTDYSG